MGNIKEIIINPITRLEGHGKISIFLDDNNEVDKAYFQVPELRGFEEFAKGRLCEDMPQITSRICGVCPSAHHMASTKALDDLYKVTPTRPAKLIRELFYNLFMFEDHLLHFYILSAPDFILGNADKATRNILGLVDKVGIETGKKLIDIRKQARNLMKKIGGKPVHPVLGLPGGVAKQISKELRDEIKDFSKNAVEFSLFSLELFNNVVLNNEENKNLILSDIFYHETNYMGLVDENNKVNFYDGKLKIIDTKANEIEKFSVSEYQDILAEHVEDWSYIKFPYLKKKGWKGFIDGEDTSLIRVAPLARLNVSDGMSTAKSQEEYEKLFDTIKTRPINNTLAIHWARLVEVVNAAENIERIAYEDELCSDDIRNMELNTPNIGIGVVEAPRGTLIHHYETDENGIITKANLLVATLFNSAPICMSVEKAAKGLIKNAQYDDTILNQIEMAFRAYDPCLSCATHNLPGKMNLQLDIYDKNKELIDKTFI